MSCFNSGGPNARGFVYASNVTEGDSSAFESGVSPRFFGAQDPLGTHVLINMGDGNPARDYEVGGIVEDVKHNGFD